MQLNVQPVVAIEAYGKAKQVQVGFVRYMHSRLRKEVRKMPRGDRTGPAGTGPMSGRGLGFCAGYDMPGFGRGWGRSAGGWRWRHWYYATGMPGWARFGATPMWGAPPPYAAPEPQREANALKEEAAWLREQLDAIEKRIAALEKEAAPPKEEAQEE